MAWRNSETNEAEVPTCWEHPAWAAYLRRVKAGAVRMPYHTSVTLEAGADRLCDFKAPDLTGRREYTNPALAKFYREWCAGRFVIPGLRVEIKTKTGTTMGPAKKSGKRIIPEKRVRIG